MNTVEVGDPQKVSTPGFPKHVCRMNTGEVGGYYLSKYGYNDVAVLTVYSFLSIRLCLLQELARHVLPLPGGQFSVVQETSTPVSTATRRCKPYLLKVVATDFSSVHATHMLREARGADFWGSPTSTVFMRHTCFGSQRC